MNRQSRIVGFMRTEKFARKFNIILLNILLNFLPKKLHIDISFRRCFFNLLPTGGKLLRPEHCLRGRFYGKAIGIVELRRTVTVFILLILLCDHFAVVWAMLDDPRATSLHSYLNKLKKVSISINIAIDFQVYKYWQKMNPSVSEKSSKFSTEIRRKQHQRLF